MCIKYADIQKFPCEYATTHAMLRKRDELGFSRQADFSLDLERQ